MKILWNYFRMIELSITDSAKKKLVKTDILGLRYKQFSGGGVKKIFFQKRKKHDFFNFWNLDDSKMDWNNGFNSSFFVGFPNNPNLDVSGHFGGKFFFWWLPLSAKAVSICRLTGRRELIRHWWMGVGVPPGNRTVCLASLFKKIYYMLHLHYLQHSLYLHRELFLSSLPATYT